MINHMIKSFYLHISRQGSLCAVRSVYFIVTSLNNFSATSNNVAHTEQEMGACPGREFEMILSCLAGANIS